MFMMFAKVPIVRADRQPDTPAGRQGGREAGVYGRQSVMPELCLSP